MDRAPLIRRLRHGAVQFRGIRAGAVGVALVLPFVLGGHHGTSARFGAGEALAADSGASPDNIFSDGLRASRPMAMSVPSVIAADPGPRSANIPAIAICIDDMGGDPVGTAKAMALPQGVTLSFLPYAAATPALALQSKELGHEVLAHVPMEPIGPSDPGPKALKIGAADNAERLAWALARVPGLSGINNHEGSKFSGDTASLVPVVEILAEKRLFFFDSRTIGRSQIVRVSHQHGVESAGRDVFLDNVLTDAAIKARLNELAAKAKKSGIAIAIGHPHGVTLRVLAAWLATDQGVRLVPVSEAIRLKTERSAVIAAR
jgi:polysaccharide deacetylase 2 family uncharacterized protein YibQ